MTRGRDSSLSLRMTRWGDKGIKDEIASSDFVLRLTSSRRGLRNDKKKQKKCSRLTSSRKRVRNDPPSVTARNETKWSDVAVSPF